jgi:hypothetical protein
VATRLCPVCGIPNPEGSTFCGSCGSRIPARFRYRFVGRFNPPRIQVDPTLDPPRRDARWVALVLGVCCFVIAGFLLVVYTLVDAATSTSGSTCGAGPGSSPCTGPIFEYLFLIPAVALLAIGALAIVWVFYEIG